MNPTDLAAWAGLAGSVLSVGGMVAVLIKARPEAKKLQADATKGVADSAASLAQGFAEDMKSLRGEVAVLKKKLEDKDDREERQERRLLVHETWDRSVAQKLRDLGEEIADPPPLYPDPAPA